MPFSGCASTQGTDKYRERFQNLAAKDHFRDAQHLQLSSIGIGTYLGNADEETDRRYAEAVVRTVELGANVIDSAANYRFQRSERSVGAAINELQGIIYKRIGRIESVGDRFRQSLVVPHQRLRPKIIRPAFNYPKVILETALQRPIRLQRLICRIYILRHMPLSRRHRAVSGAPHDVGDRHAPLIEIASITILPSIRSHVPNTRLMRIEPS